MVNKRVYSVYLSEQMKILTDSYIDEKLKSYRSQQNFKYYLNGLLDHTKKSPEQMKEEDLRSYFEYLIINRGNKHDTVHTKKQYFLSYFRFLDERKDPYHIKKDFENMILRINVKNRVPDVKAMNVLSVEIVKEFLIYLEYHELWHLRLAAELAVRYGLTSSRILRLTAKDLYRSDHHYYLRVIEKPDTVRKNIGLKEDTVKLFLKVCDGNDEVIFRSKKKDKTLSVRRLEQLISDAGKEVTDTPVTLSKLRNTCIVFLLYEGASYDDIEFMTGSPAAMLFRYKNQTGRIADAALKHKSILDL
ncbi:MAG: phage integrase N-terminal SAM-like domain-containing protein [Lachnospiraceae bacterium]|nr:phage integrase N-terminal SAM-like domain-containing protein [Lachnospiraceae bacterium]